MKDSLSFFLTLLAGMLIGGTIIAFQLKAEQDPISTEPATAPYFLKSSVVETYFRTKEGCLFKMEVKLLSKPRSVRDEQRVENEVKHTIHILSTFWYAADILKKDSQFGVELFELLRVVTNNEGVACINLFQPQLIK